MPLRGRSDRVCGSAAATNLQLWPGHPLVLFLLSFTLTATAGTCFDYGIVSNGPVSISGNALITGVNSSQEGSIYTNTSADTAVALSGIVRVQGDVYVANPDSHASLNSNVSIGGATGWAAYDHIHFGAAPYEIPEVDPTIFERFATNIVDRHTSTAGKRTFTNIRIKANTNPTFTGNITIDGIVYIEKPNRVTFAGNLELTGMIVTDPGHDTTNNQINFLGITTTTGVEDLPDTSEFHELRTLTGSFLLAPGFTTTFTGNVGIINGTMAADAYTFAGNCGGIIRGSLVNYGTATLTLAGNSALAFDHSGYSGEPAGFASVPEPAALSLLVAAIGSIFTRRR